MCPKCAQKPALCDCKFVYWPTKYPRISSNQTGHNMEMEYKIVQATTPHFAKSGNLKAILEEEAQSGWQLVEKFDNYKLRLQRDISHRTGDATRSVDAYRTQVGVSNFVTYGAATIVTLAVVYIVFQAVGTF